MSYENLDKQLKEEKLDKYSSEKPEDLSGAQETTEDSIKAIARSVDPEFEVEIKTVERSGFKTPGTPGAPEDTIIVVRKPSDARFPKVIPYEDAPERLKKLLQDLLI